MQSPYATLDVPPSATPEEIKQAYRRRSSACHPDRHGGDSRLMQEVNDAYAILSDPQRRAHYDATGETKEVRALDNAKQMLQNELGKLLENANVGDLVQALRSQVQMIEANARSARAQNQLRERILIKRLKALKGPKESDFLVGVIDGRLKQVQASMIECDQALEALVVAQALLLGYTYQEETEAQSRPGMTFIGLLGGQAAG